MNAVTPIATPKQQTSAAAPFARPELPCLAGGLAMAVAGAVLVSLPALAPERASLALAAAAFTLGAVVELAAGARLAERGSAGMPHIMAGATGLGFAAFVLALCGVRHDAFIAGPMTLLLGVHCICNALISSLDLALSRPTFTLARTASALLRWVVGVAAVEVWHGASPTLLSVLTGSALVAVGLAVVGNRHSLAPPMQTVRSTPVHLS